MRYVKFDELYHDLPDLIKETITSGDKDIMSFFRIVVTTKSQVQGWKFDFFMSTFISRYFR